MTATSCGEPGPVSPILRGGSPMLFTSERDGNIDIYIMEPDGSAPRRLTRDDAIDRSSDWSPDARTSSDSPTTRSAKGGGAWSPDGSRIAFHAYRDSDADIYVSDVDGANETQLTSHPALDRYPVWSVDGRSIGFTSDRDGDDEIYVMNADGAGAQRLTHSTGLDILDAWRR